MLSGQLTQLPLAANLPWDGLNPFTSVVTQSPVTQKPSFPVRDYSTPKALTESRCLFSKARAFANYAREQT